MSSMVRLATKKRSPLALFKLVVDCFCWSELLELVDPVPTPEDAALADDVAPMPVVEFESELDACSSSLSIF